MFITLLVVTFLIALAVSFVVVRMFTAPVENILDRIISDEISIEWLKYLKFAIYVVGYIQWRPHLGSRKIHYTPAV